MLFAPLLYAGFSFSLLATPAQEAEAGATQQAENAPEIVVDETWHPAGPEEFKEALGIKKIEFKEWPGLQLYCKDRKLFKLLTKALDKSWPMTLDMLGGSPFPKGRNLRIIALNEEELLTAYFEIMKKGAAAGGVADPPSSLLQGLLKSGSATWNLPPTLLLRPNYVGKSIAPTRTVHDASVIAASWASSFSGYGAPEFLLEGFAGMMVRRAIKKPASLVSHKAAAVSEKIHGYGVFQGIGAALNNADNAPANWPRLMHNAIKAMLKKEESVAAERIDALLLRTHQNFARTDYAYAWAAMEFLFDATVIPDAAAADGLADDAQVENEEKPIPPSRRRGLHRVLAQLKAPEFSVLDQTARSAKFRELLLAEYAEDSLRLHQAFLNWAQINLPKR